MPNLVITKSTDVAKASLPPNARVGRFKTAQTGLALFVTKNKKYWQGRICLDQKYRHQKFGDADRPESQGGLSFNSAQKAYFKWQEDLAKGTDQLSIRKKAEATTQNNFLDLAQNFLNDCEARELSQGSIENYKRVLIDHPKIKPFHKRSVKAIEPDEFYHVLMALEKKKSGKNIGVKAALSAFYSYLAKNAVLFANPIISLSVKPYKPDERRLTHNEIKTLWDFDFSMRGEDRFKHLYRLCFLTGGMRSGAIMGGRFSEINEKDGVWVIPASRMKRKGVSKSIDHAIPLLNPIREEINKLRTSNQDFMFAQKAFDQDQPRKHVDGRYLRPVFYLNQARDKIPANTRQIWKTRTGIKDLKPSTHIRKAVFSELSDIGVEPFHVDLIQGSISETKSGRRKHYNFSEYLELKKDTLEKWHKHLFKIVA